MEEKKRQFEPEIKKGPGKTSPYVIHLSHETHAKPKPSSSPNLDLLAAQLTSEFEDVEQEEQDDLLLDFEDIVHQLHEQDYHPTETEGIEEISSSLKEENISSVTAEALVQPKKLMDELVEEPVETTQAPSSNFFTKIRSAELPEIPQVPVTGMRTKAIAAFVALSFAFVLPLHAIQQVQSSQSLQGEVLAAGNSAIEHFMRGAAALENEQFTVAEIDFTNATEDFAAAEASLHEFNIALATLAQLLPQTSDSYSSAKGLITAGKELATAASILTDAVEDIQSQEALTATTKLSLLNTYITSALPHIDAATDALEDVDPNAVPLEFQETVTELKQKGPALASSLHEFNEFSDALITIMGGDRKMRYLVLFQNNTELRATGGFPGSFAEIDVMNGEITDIHIPPGGTYDVQGQLSAFVAAPEPISLINPRWEFHDANWFPDFPTSAQKTLWFYEQAGGPTMDGVIAVNASLMPKLLEITGPVEMPEYERTIDAENFLFETRKIIEFEYENYKDEDNDREEEAPKQFIGDLAPIMLEKLTEADVSTTLSMLDVLGDGLREKDVLFYLEDNALQSEIKSLGWTGEQKTTEGDYLMVVNTNVGGGKTDMIIDQDIDFYSQLQPDGSALNTVTITKEHKGLQTALFEGVNNVDYLRVYTPKGSTLISAEGFERPPAELFEPYEVELSIDEDIALIESDRHRDPISQTDIWNENGKTVFGNWIQTKPGEIETITFTYRTPPIAEPVRTEITLFEKLKEYLGFKNLEPYTIFIQKQPGVETRTTRITLELPSGKETVWGSHRGELPNTNIEVSNTTDQLLRFLLQDQQ